ncbi:hypothetical protein [Sulfurivermis fontis]|uniref:hypothetical protein n=1 Tax=Sulfurivermis fontis TaxID=1972068 RepID=UPI000FDBDB94|nr:hypothetical protein [Sulfurivermis fontis]
MDLQNLAYALTQVAHNFGAVAVVGAPLFARWPLRLQAAARRPLAWLVLIGWAVQGLSGAGFGAISYVWYGAFPDIHGIAVAALLLKMACAATGFVLAGLLLLRALRWPAPRHEAVWGVLLLLGVTALTAAAFLRWFS